MSPTSSRQVTRHDQRGLSRYHRGVWLVAAIALVATVAGLVTYALQGPRLRAASVDVVRAVQFPGSLLQLESDRPLQGLSAEQVTVEPAAPVSVDVSDSIVSVVFEQALRYSTEYTVRIDGVAGEARGIGGQWEYSFSTPQATVHYLDRGQEGQPDRIMRVGTQGQAPEEVYSAPGLGSFVVIGSALMVASETAVGESRLDIIEPVGDGFERLVLPERTRIDQLFAPATGTRAMFTLSSLDPDGPYDRTLFVADAAGSSLPEPVIGLDGENLRVTKAAIVPGSSRVVAWVDEVRVVSIDLDTGLVLPITQEAQEFWGVSAGGDAAVLVDLGGTVAIGIDDLEEQRLVPGTIGTRSVFEGQTHVMNDARRIQTVVLGNSTDTEFTSLVALDDGQGTAMPLYRTPDDLGSIGRFVVSPGDQYVAIEVSPNRQTARDDGRSIEPRDANVTTVIIDIDSGRVVRSVEGFWPIW